MSIGAAGWMIVILNFFKWVFGIVARVFRRAEAVVKKRDSAGERREKAKKTHNLRERMQANLDIENLREKE